MYLRPQNKFLQGFLSISLWTVFYCLLIKYYENLPNNTSFPASGFDGIFNARARETRLPEFLDCAVGTG